MEATAPPRSSGTLNGAGATFPQPVYTEWANRFREQFGVTVNYQGIGSGGGIAQFTEGTIDWGATDAALDEEELAAAQRRASRSTSRPSSAP